MSKNSPILKRDTKNNIDISKYLDKKREEEVKSNYFWHSIRGRLLIVVGTAIAIVLNILAFISFHAPGFLIYGLGLLVCGATFFFCTFSDNNKKDSRIESEIKISKNDISLMEKSLKKPHLEYQNIAVTDSGIIDLKSFHRVKYNDIIWVYQTEKGKDIAIGDIAIGVATFLDFGIPAVSNSDVRTYLVLKTKKDETVYLGDHTAHSNGFINATRKKYKCSREFEEFRNALLEKCPDGAIYGNDKNNEKEYYRRIGKPMPVKNDTTTEEHDEDVDDGL